MPRDQARARMAAGDQHCWRIRVQNAPKTFVDHFQGEVTIDLDALSGDFVIQRADGLFAYQLACAIDDALSGITEVLRGGDLLDSGARQSWILKTLGLPIPRYWHIPLLYSPTGERLSKRDGADDLRHYIDRGCDIIAIRGYLACTLGQCEPGERPTMAALIERFDIERIPRHDVRFDPQLLQKFRP
jgi:glutamyl-tRNA synthetase